MNTVINAIDMSVLSSAENDELFSGLVYMNRRRHHD